MDNSGLSNEGGLVKADDVMPQVPNMRAVALTNGPVLAYSSGEILLEGKSSASTLSPLRKGLLKPPSRGIPRLSSAGLYRNTSDRLFGVEQEWTGVTTSSWDVKAEHLQMVPWEFPLERTHREIFAESLLVATRITDTLRMLSIEAEYSAEKANAKCKTSDMVSFRIRLYAGSENGQPVVVELQRRSGSASCFMRTCRAVLDAAEGKPVKMAPTQSSGMQSSRLAPVRSLKCLANVDCLPRDSEAEAKSALHGAMLLFRSNCRDSSLLGLENMCCITDPMSTSPETALGVSKVLLADKDLREEIRLLTEHDSFAGDNETQLLNHRKSMCCMALAVFANALSVCNKDGCLRSLAENIWFNEFLIPSILDQLSRVNTDLNSACHAACGLHYILGSSKNACKLTVGIGGARESVEEAFAVGKLRHELLATESRHCLALLNLLD